MRLELWPSRLARLIEQAKDKSFRWGEHDCCLFACKAIEALMGFDPGEPFKGKYSDQEEGERILSRDGGVEGIARKVAKEKNYREVSQLFAQRGDICLAEIAGRQMLGVCIGAEFAFAGDPKGLYALPLGNDRIKTVWRIE